MYITVKYKRYEIVLILLFYTSTNAMMHCNPVRLQHPL